MCFDAEPPLPCAGSSFAWLKESDAGADNLIPMEIAQKIVHAIKRNERFAAYIVLPLHPDTEGFSRCRASRKPSTCSEYSLYGTRYSSLNWNQCIMR